MVPPLKDRTTQKKSRKKLVGVPKQSTRCLFTYKEENLLKAIEDIQNKKMGFREACRSYGVPKTTVHDRLSGKVAINKKPKVGPDPILGIEGEKKLADWVVTMAKCGFPISKSDLLENVSKVIKNSGLKTPFTDGKPGETWYQKFLKRHPEISLREPEAINNARAAVTETRIRSWFKELKTYIESLGASDLFEDPNRIFNGDETGFSLCPKSGKVLGPKGYKNLYVIKKGNEKENITVLVVFSASGKLCPPLVVFPYVRPPKAVIENMPDTWVLGRSESGWMKSDVFFEYVTNDFNSWLETNNIKKPIILFIDGHKSHMTFALSEYCEKNGIILYALPANTTHMLQPADVSVFKPLKQHWKNMVKEWQSEHVNQTVTKLNFCKILNKILTEDHLCDPIKNGFKKCGLYPLNENNVDYSKCVRDIQEKTKNSNSMRKSRVNAKDFDSAIKIIAFLEADLTKRNIAAKPIIEEIEMAKVRYLETRRSKSKTPRNSAASDLSTSILIDGLGLANVTDTAVTPENLSFDILEIGTQPLNQNMEISSVNKEIATTFTIDNESTIQTIDLPEPGSYISLENISVMPLDEIEISQQVSNLELPVSECTITVLADVHDERNEINNAFDNHLHFPEPATQKDTKKRCGPKLPSAVSSKAWREHYKRKDEEKENLEIEKKRKRALKAEEKERKIKEKKKTKNK